MSQAWEVTEEDVQTVLDKHGIQKQAEDVFDSVNPNIVEDAALNGDDMDEQVNYALQSIEEQLMEDGVIPKGPSLFEQD